MPEKMIDLGEAMRKSAVDDIWAIRGKAIQAYADLEQALARLFAGLSETKLSIASIIFFRISNTDARNRIIEKLFKKKFLSQFNLFRNSMLDQLRSINIERNEIVHWNVVNHVGLDEHGKTTSLPLLMPPTFWVNDGNRQTKGVPELLEFIVKCQFYSGLLNMFCVMTGLIPGEVPVDEAVRQTWLDIFSQQIVYPPPSTHPLSPELSKSATEPKGGAAG
jgi:hypothetical protein